MRRDYFTCLFLFLVAVSLSFVCLLPTYFSYGGVIERKISLLETLVSVLFSVLVVLVVPIICTIKKKLWATLGIATFGFVAYIPGMILPGMQAKLAMSDVSFLTTLKAFILEAIYIMVNAPYVGISFLTGQKFALALPKLVMPFALGAYLIAFLIRFYKDAYIRERLAPVPNDGPKEEANTTREPDILGTVISAPKEAKTAETTPAPAPVRTPAPVESETKVVPRPSAQPQPKPQQPKPQPQQPKVRQPQINIPPAPAPQPAPQPKVVVPPAPQPQPQPQAQQKPSNPNPGVRRPIIEINRTTPKKPESKPITGQAIELGAPAPAPKPDNGAIQLGPPSKEE